MEQVDSHICNRYRALSGSLSMNKGIQTGFAASISIVGNDVFVFPEHGGKGTQTIIRYARSYKGLEKAAEMRDYSRFLSY